jgi:hypothetical protein
MVGTEVIAEETMYMLLPHHQNTGQNDIKTAKRFFLIEILGNPELYCN